MISPMEPARWIWDESPDNGINQFRCFRKTFNVEREMLSGNVQLLISADSLFEAFLNGKRLKATQFSDYPDDKVFSEIELTPFLNEGKNLLAVRVQYLGEDFSTYALGSPGLIALIQADGKILAETGTEWKCAADPAFHSGLTQKVTGQLGFVFEYDAREETGWNQPEYDDTGWQNAVIRNRNCILNPRTVPFLKELDQPAVTAVQYGYLKRPDTGGTFAKQCAGDFLQSRLRNAVFTPESNPVDPAKGYYCDPLILYPDGSRPLVFLPIPDGCDGCYIILDLGRETVGYLNFSLTAAAGTVVDISHGEHLDSGRVRMEIHGRNFTDRYHCREGKNEFTYSLRRIGARYLELHLTNTKKLPVTLYYAGVIPVELPLPKKSHFLTDDGLHMAVHRRAIDTLKLCMHEHYEDCPWREQALYAYDSRNQMLYGYYLWGNAEFAAASLELLGKSYFGEDYLCLTAPSQTRKRITIPCFTMVWIVELYEHYLHTGSLRLFEKFRPTVESILKRALERRTPNGLYHAGNSEIVWNFYEWTTGFGRLDRYPQAPYNLYFYEALRAAEQLSAASGDETNARKLHNAAIPLGKLLETTFWQESAECYATFPADEENTVYHEHVQALMLFNGLVPQEKLPRLLNTIRSGTLVPASYSAMPYLLRGMMDTLPEARAHMEQVLRKTFEPPVLSGATSLWETEFGGDDFSDAGSLCHAWSSITAYYSNRYVLGVSPLLPGFRKFQVKPYPGHLLRAEGTVPTPAGNIFVSWFREGNGIRLTIRHPAELEAVVEEFEEFPLLSVQLEKQE